MIETLMAFSWLFWLAFAFTFLALGTASYNEKPGWFVFLLIIGGTALLFASGHSLNDAWNYLNSNPLTVLKWFFTYIAVGVVYAIARWYFFLRGIRGALLDFRAGHPDYRSSEVPLSKDALDSFKRSQRMEYKSFPPRVSDYKDHVLNWMILWSFAWVDLRPLTKLFNLVYNGIASALQGMSDRMFKGLA